MGCSHSSHAGDKESEKRSSVGNVATSHRRLSVGHDVDPETVPACDVDTTGVDRSLIAQLYDNSIIQLVNSRKKRGRGGGLASIETSIDYEMTSFVNKSMEAHGDLLDPSCGLGYTCRKGLRPGPNQDSMFVFKMQSCAMYAVFDGHGHTGQDVANFVKDILPKLIIKDPKFAAKENIEDVLRSAFAKSQDIVNFADRSNTLNAQTSGTTATVCFHDYETKKMTVAHVANSTAVLGRRNPDVGKVEAVPLTRDHTPDLQDERVRIEKAGGRVVFDGFASHRVYADGKCYPGLNVSRCIGDIIGHAECGVSSEPDICQHALTSEDILLLLCSDGVWQFISFDEAVSIVSEYKTCDMMLAADSLAREAWDRWIRAEGSAVVDDITVVVADLRNTPSGFQ
eukprot:TRINITY_DN73031_c0_g1_i1.p1 TRINITY_DN73031_c0_g1~~TRINITY_DN73031_c0_g1_i1.p1  ORF type:complete len:418 (-),score=58.61 TRINITY_DN73031_c0_g1_i1:788-1978(-)